MAGAPIRNHQGEVRFSPSATGTLVEWTVRFDPLIPFTGALVSRVMRRVLRDILERLAAYDLESPG